MKIKPFLVFLFALGLSLPGLAMAECSGKICHDVKIERLVVYESGQVAIGTTGDESRLTCTTSENGYRYLKVRPESELFDQLYSFLLSMKLADKEISIRVNDDNSNCRVIYAYID